MDLLEELIDYVFDGAINPQDVISKMDDASEVHVNRPLTTKKEKRAKIKNTVGQGLNALAMGAGTHALVMAGRDERLNAAGKADAKAGKKSFARAASAPYRAYEGSKYAKMGLGVKTARAKKYAIPLAGGALALHGAELVGDSIAAQALHDKGKTLKKAKVNDLTVKKSENDLLWTGEISKVDDEKRQVFGWCSLTEVDGEPVVDRQGDYIPLHEVEKSAYNYVVHSRKGGDMHKRDGESPLHTSDLIESFVVTPEKLEKLGLEPDAVPHGWWVGFKINDDNQWEDVKKGDRSYFSIHGKGQRVEKHL